MELKWDQKRGEGQEIAGAKGMNREEGRILRAARSNRMETQRRVANCFRQRNGGKEKGKPEFGGNSNQPET